MRQIETKFKVRMVGVIDDQKYQLKDGILCNIHH